MSNFFDIHIQEIRRPEVSYRIKVRWFTTIREVKEQLHNITKYPIANMQLFHTSTSIVLSNKTTLRELGIGLEHATTTLLLSLQFASQEQNLVQPISNLTLDSDCRELIRQVRAGFNNSCGPSKTDVLDCTGGVYFLRSANGSIAAVFKPRDEEQGMPNNPKGYDKASLRENYRPGKGFIREVAAYLMDIDGFCGVPPTTIVHCEHPSFNYPRKNSLQRTFPKLGSLQKFVRATDIFEDIGISMIGTFEVQKIALFDMRILNGDRNSANILASRKLDSSNNSNRPRRKSRSESLASLTEDSCDELDMQQFLDAEPTVSSKSGENDFYELIPIDHGYCFPSKLMIDELDWAWFECPQLKKPVDPAIIEYLNSFKIEDVIEAVTSQISIPQESLFLIQVVDHLLRKGIEAKLTLRDIAGLIARTQYGVPSPLEKAIADSEDIAFRAIEARSSYHYPATSFNDMSSPRLSEQSSLVHNLLSMTSATRKDKMLKSTNNNSKVDLRLDELGSFSNDIHPSIATFSSFQSNEGAFVTRTVSETSTSSPNSMGPHDYFVRDLDSPIKHEGCNGNSSQNKFASEDTTSRPKLEPPPFSSLEVPTTEFINFDKPTKSNNRERAFSCYTSEEENDSGGESLASSPSDCSMLDYFKSGLYGMPLASMPRVVSFGAFESPSIYDVNDKADRQFLKLRKERRKQIAKTPEFRNLKLKFSYEVIDNMLTNRYAK